MRHFTPQNRSRIGCLKTLRGWSFLRPDTRLEGFLRGAKILREKCKGYEILREIRKGYEIFAGKSLTLVFQK